MTTSANTKGSPSPAEDVEVRREDQERINEFGRNANHLQELNGDRTEISKQLEFLEDAEQEVLLSEDADQHAVRMGSAFLSVSEDEFNDFIEDRRAKLAAKYDEKGEKIDKIQERQAVLKTALYGRFGGNINLEQ